MWAPDLENSRKIIRTLHRDATIADKMHEKVAEKTKHAWYFPHYGSRVDSLSVPRGHLLSATVTESHHGVAKITTGDTSDYFPPLARLIQTVQCAFPLIAPGQSLSLRHWTSYNHKLHIYTPVEMSHTEKRPFFLSEPHTGSGNLLTGRSSCCEIDREIDWSYCCRAPGDAEVRYKPHPSQILLSWKASHPPSRVCLCVFAHSLQVCVCDKP